MTVGVRRSSHRTQWAAQFAVASELCKLCYEVALTMGNHPHVDIMARSPNGISFDVDVKGQYKKGFWAVSPKPKREQLFYVLCFVPDGQANQFFVLAQDEMNKEINRFKWRAARRKR